MLSLLLILLLTWLVMAALMWGFTQLGQGALYEEPPEQLYWRAPAAAAGVTAFLVLWALLNYAGHEPGRPEPPYDTVFRFTTERVSEPLPEFVAETKEGQKVRYRLRRLGGVPPQVEYRDENNNLWQTTRVAEATALVVKEKDQEARFKADPARKQFVEEGGKRFVPYESAAAGRVTTPNPGRSAFGLLLNAVHFAVWFACLWLLLRFQWPHALGLAAVLWLVMTFVAGNFLDRAKEARDKAAATTSARSRAVTKTLA